MRPVIFTQDEANYILNAIDQRIQKSDDGIVDARIAVDIVAKLQEALKPTVPVGDKSATD